MANFIPLSLLLVSMSLTLCSARPHVHRGPEAGAPVRVIEGHFFSQHKLRELPDKYSLTNVADFTFHIKKDVIFADELVGDGLESLDCTSSSKSASARLFLSGPVIEKDDYSPGTVFIIGAKMWEQKCGRPALFASGKEFRHHILFLNITRASHIVDGRTAVLEVSSLMPSEVMPEMKFNIEERHVPENISGKVMVLQGTSDFLSYRKVRNFVADENLTMSTAERLRIPTFTDGNTQVTFSFNAKLKPKTRDWAIRCKLITCITTWIQVLRFEGDVGMSIDRTLASAQKRVLIAHGPIALSGLDFLVGELGAFWKIDGVVEASLKAGVAIEFPWQFVLQSKMRVDHGVGLIPIYSMKKPDLVQYQVPILSSLGSGDVHGSMNGFIGIRPAIGIGEILQNGYLDANTNIGVKAGVELDLTAKVPPFPIYDGSDVKKGVCNQCHSVRAQARMILKDFVREVDLPLAVTKTRNRFGLSSNPVPFFTWCIKEQKCPSLPDHRCTACRRDGSCDRGQLCKDGQCYIASGFHGRCDEAECVTCEAGRACGGNGFCT